jgi:HK97 family phage prohead protease
VNVPTVNELHAAENAEGLLLSGYVSTPTLDRANDVVNPHALKAAVAKYLRTNPVLLWAHKLSLPPLGKVLNARIDSRGIFIEALLPRPAPGTFAAEIYNAVKNGVARGLSLGGSFYREARRGFAEVTDMELREISLCSLSVGHDTLVDSVVPTEVKSLGDGLWVDASASVNEQIAARVRHHCHRQLEASIDQLGLELSGRLIAANAQRSLALQPRI